MKTHHNIAEDLRTKGWSVQPDYLGDELSHILLRRLKILGDEDALSEAGIGRKQAIQIAPDIRPHIRPDIRRDKTFWLETTNDADKIYLSLMEQLRLSLNSSLFMGLFDYEAHYAIYPPGGFYKKHVDAFKGEKNRLVSTVCYLNENWRPEDGGHLALFDSEDDNKLIHHIEPKIGTLVVFLSEEIPHEVTTAYKDRKSIAGWFRCNASSAHKVDPLK